VADIGPNNQYDEPLFMGQATGDYHLDVASPLIDAGDPDGAYNDTDNSRNDIGLYGGAILPGQGGSIQTVTAGALETGYYLTYGHGQSQVTTFVPATDFNAGDDVVIRVHTVDAFTGQAIEGVTADLSLTGPEAVALTTNASDADGNADEVWGTSAPNRKGTGGTTPGQYTVNLTGMTVAGILWDGVPVNTTFNIN